MEISFTRYRIYRECPWKYKLFFLDGKVIPLNPKSSFGLSLHRALEAWLAGGDGSLESGVSALKSHWISEGYPDKASEARWYAKAKRAIARFHGEESSRRSRLVALEREFVWKLATHDVRGMIDRIDQGADGAYEIVEYKTGPSAPAPAQVAADLQLKFYALGARRALGLSPSTLTVDCVTLGIKVSVHYEPSGEEALASDIAQAATAIESAVFVSDTSFCPRCDFRNDCQYSVARDPRPKP